VLAQKFWHGAWVIVVFSLINSVVAFSIATATVTTRMCYAMGRTGAMPAVFARLHPVHRTPTTAIWVQTVVTVALGFIVAVLLGASQTFVFLGLMVTFSLIFVYFMGNIGAFLAVVRGRTLTVGLTVRSGFVPLLSSIALIWLGYKSLVPLPAKPLLYAPLIVGIWLVAGVALLWVMSLRGQEGWLLEAGHLTQTTGSASVEAET
jgi:amino acid transporter